MIWLQNINFVALLSVGYRWVNTSLVNEGKNLIFFTCPSWRGKCALCSISDLGKS